MEHSGGERAPPALYRRLCETCLRGSRCERMRSCRDSATKDPLRSPQCWRRSGREPRAREKDGRSEAPDQPAPPWAALGRVLTRGAVSPASSCFFPSFPAEGNNLSPEQIKSDLHEI